MKRLRIGLTGGIGSGKSTVAATWVGLGATLVDTDAIAHALCAPRGAALLPLKTNFGGQIMAHDGGMDRQRMRSIVFSDPSARLRLEAILHPMIRDEALQQAATATGAVIFDVPLLTESPSWRLRCDLIAVIDCKAETQVARVVARSGWSTEQVERVIAQQVSRSQRRAIADAVIYNEAIGIGELRQQSSELWLRWLGSAL